MVFGRLTTSGDKYKKGDRYVIIARCECGITKEYNHYRLLSGTTKSCGCYRREFRTIEATHGKSDHPLHGVWDNIKSRCNNPKTKHYDRYGGRGIKMCDKWSSSFKFFYDWAILNGWEASLQIDRKDNNLGYSPDNCRFVTPKINNRNRGNNKINIDGVVRLRDLHETGEYTLKKLSEMFEISISQVYNIASNKQWIL